MSDVFMKFQELFDHMIDEHNVTLLESEMREIIRICQKIENNDSQKSSIMSDIISESKANGVCDSIWHDAHITQIGKCGECGSSKKKYVTDER